MPKTMKVKGNEQWTRLSSRMGVVNNTSQTAYRDSIKARKNILDLKNRLDKFEKLLESQDDNSE